MNEIKERFWIALGDIHEHTGPLQYIPDVDKAEAILISGDLTNIGTAQTAEKILGVLAQKNARIFAQIGNMDTQAVSEVLDARGVNVHGRTVDLGEGVCLAAVGYSTPTPFGTPSEESEEQICAWLRAVLENAQAWKHIILMVHTPPLASVVDRIMGGPHVGSAGVRDLILEFQPDLVITGHIHEGRGEELLGESLVINPGSFAEGGYVRIRQNVSGLMACVEQAL